MKRFSAKLSSAMLVTLALVLAGLMLTSGMLAASEVVRLDLFIELLAPEHVEPGGEYTVNLSYGNSNSAVTPEDTWVEAALPDGVTLLSAEDKHHNPLLPDSCDGNTLHWDVGRPIPDWETEHIYILVRVDQDLPQNSALTLHAEIGSSAAERDYENNTASVTSLICDMAGSYKQAQAYEFMPADAVTYTVTLKLAQGESLGYRDVTMVDQLPPTSQARFLGWTSEEAGTYDGSQLRWQGRVYASQPVQLQYRLGIEGDLPAGSAVMNQAYLYWGSGELALEPVEVLVTLPDSAAMIGPQGGEMQANRVTLSVPAGAVPEITRFELEALFEGTLPDSRPPGWFYAGTAFELTATCFDEIHQFDGLLQIAVDLQEGQVAGLKPETLRLWYRNAPELAWQLLGEPHSHLDGRIIYQTDHFTEYALFGVPAHQVHTPLVFRD